jgi:hypothetical protein
MVVTLEEHGQQERTGKKVNCTINLYIRSIYVAPIYSFIYYTIVKRIYLARCPTCIIRPSTAQLSRDQPREGGRTYSAAVQLMKRNTTFLHHHRRLFPAAGLDFISGSLISCREDLDQFNFD